MATGNNLDYLVNDIKGGGRGQDLGGFSNSRKCDSTHSYN